MNKSATKLIIFLCLLASLASALRNTAERVQNELIDDDAAMDGLDDEDLLESEDSTIDFEFDEEALEDVVPLEPRVLRPKSSKSSKSKSSKRRKRTRRKKKKRRSPETRVIPDATPAPSSNPSAIPSDAPSLVPTITPWEFKNIDFSVWGEVMSTMERQCCDASIFFDVCDYGWDYELIPKLVNIAVTLV